MLVTPTWVGDIIMIVVSSSTRIVSPVDVVSFPFTRLASAAMPSDLAALQASTGGASCLASLYARGAARIEFISMAARRAQRRRSLPTGAADENTHERDGTSIIMNYFAFLRGFELRQVTDELSLAH